MPDDAKQNSSNFQDTAKKIAVMDRPNQINAIKKLGEWVSLRDAGEVANQAMNAFNILRSQPGNGPKLALEFVASLRGKIPHSLIIIASPLLENNTIPLGLRLTVGGRFISCLSDRMETVGPIVRAITAKVGRTKRLTRLYALQSKVLKSETLDRFCSEAEKKTKIKCPTCKKSFNRPNLIKHLWKKHKSELSNGKLVTPEKSAELLIESAKEKLASLDQAFIKTPQLFPKFATIASVHQGLASRGWRSSDQYSPLVDQAAEHDCGICPICYGDVRDPMGELPRPMNLSHGQMSGDGFLVKITEHSGIRKALISSPGKILYQGLDQNQRMSPRFFATVIGLLISIAGIVCVFTLPWKNSLTLAIWFVIAALIAYTCAWAFRKPIADKDERAIDLAWNYIVPGLGRSKKAVKLLTRLCRTSIQAGDANLRSAQVWEMADQANVLAGKGSEFNSLFAAVQILKAADTSDIGKEISAELSKQFEGFFRREYSAIVAEKMAIMIQEDCTINAIDSQKLSILLASQAFDAELQPYDLLSLRRYMPEFCGLLPENSDHLKCLYTVWSQRKEKPWAKTKELKDCETIFSLIRKNPGLANRILAKEPETVLIYTPDDFLLKLFGPVLVTRRGVVFGKAVVSDPNAEITVSSTREGGELIFGKTIFSLNERPRDALEIALKKILQYRVDFLTQQIESSFDGTGSVQSYIDDFKSHCKLCNAASFIRAGQLGVPAI